MNNELNKIFTSKSNVLLFLKTKIKKAKIEKLYIFTTDEWLENKPKILNKISNSFNQKIVIRSSAIGEDSIESSEAGKFESFLDIDSKSKKVIKLKIEKVIKSYKNGKNYNKQNQILVQNQSKNIITSGVIFSRTPDNGSPYYVINYEDGGSTIGVTQGSINNLIKIFRNTNKNIIPEKWKLLLKAVKELESILGSSFLDIEFGINKSNEIIIFQVRPITSIINMDTNIDDKVENLINKLQTKFTKLTNLKENNPKIFSDMADWNPAEIIGIHPNPLALSLYKFLITDNIWAKQRSEFGYRDVGENSLILSFCGQPYIDLRASFNSFIPAAVDDELAEKLVEAYLGNLSLSPEYHDKVEFDIAITSWTPTYRKNAQDRLKSWGLNSKEIDRLGEALKLITSNAIVNFKEHISMQNLAKRRVEILQSKINL